MVTAAMDVAPSAGPLTPNHLRELADATERSKLIRKTARVANFNGWTTAILAASSAIFTLLADQSVVGFLVTAGLTVVAFNELRGKKRLLAFDPSAASLLGWNQLGLLAMIVVYCLWNMRSGASMGDLKTPEMKEALDMIGWNAALVQTMAVAFYGVVILLSAIFQGGNALYYFSRRKYVERYVRETPEWVRDFQRANSPT